jgi:hypothetical protein
VASAVLLSTVIASSACVIATMPSARSGSKLSSSSSRSAIGKRQGLASPTTRSSWLHVAFADAAVREHVTQAGGTWNPDRRVWQLRYDRVIALRLASRIVDERTRIQ